MEIPWILVSVAILILALAVLFVVWAKKDNKRTVDYRSYYTMGIVWLPLGIIFTVIFENIVGIFFFVMGVIYLSIGLKNRDKWGKPQKIPKKQQRMLAIAVLVGVLLLVAGILAFEMLS